MKSAVLFAPLVLFSGCVGYNTTLFMTKSNAGLDLDAKPPTAEINISRKEGVIAPSFEGGQTPPVMASFSAKSGSGGMSRFFFGVNQSFAGGDAAVTMAKLYDSPAKLVDTGDEGATNRARFDSGFSVSEPPKANSKGGWRKLLFGLAEPGEVRPFFFGTDTQLGVKVAWNGVGGPYPDTVKIGFNRKELAIAPVTISDENVVRIPSFLATVDTNVRGSSTNGTNTLRSELGLSWMQYFATGASADYLSRQYGVRKAMLERVDPKASEKSDAQRAGEKQHEKVVQQAAEMVKWATKEGKLDSASIETLVKGTDLAASQEEIKKMAPADFQKKLNASWSVYVDRLWAHFPNKPQE